MKRKKWSAHGIVFFVMALMLCTYITATLDPLMIPQVTTLRVSGRSFPVPLDAIREVDGQPVVFFVREESSALGPVNRLIMLTVTIIDVNGSWRNVQIQATSSPSGGRLVHLSSRPLEDRQRVVVIE